MKNYDFKNTPNSIINKWLSDKHPVRVSGKDNHNEKKIEIKVTDSIEEALENKL